MPRIGQIKPEFYLDAELAQCSREARLLFPGLWILADRAGRLKNRPAKIKAQIFPYDSDIDAATITERLQVVGLFGEPSRNRTWNLLIKSQIQGSPHHPARPVTHST